MEIWKIYKKTNQAIWEVSNLGNVKKNGVTYECKKIRGGYLVFGHNCLVHRAVAELFIENPENKKEVDHIDTNVQNNHYTNLRWCTRKENQNNTLTIQHYSEARKGKNHPRAKAVAKCSLSGEILEIRSCMSDFEKDGFDKSGISLQCKGILKSYKGFKWQYI